MREAALATTFGEATGVPPVFANSGGMSLLYPMTVLPDLRSFSAITLPILPIPIRPIASSFAIPVALLARPARSLGRLSVRNIPMGIVIKQVAAKHNTV